MDYMKRGRGRPRKDENYIEPEPQAGPRKFTKEYKDYNGDRQVWTYNLDKNPDGPISVENFYKEEPKCEIIDEKSLPKTQRKYLNPATQKMVSYTRAYQLGLIK